MTANLRIEALGDRAVLVHLDERIAVDLNQQVHLLADRLAALPGISEVVPAYASLALLLAPGVWFDAALQAQISAVAGMSFEQREVSDRPQRPLRVRFDGEDLDTVATAHGISAERLVERLCGPVYQVAMLGFLPGFPYLLGLDAGLSLPRRRQPRSRVPANSLALGGSQLGIYPCTAPGGWHLLGTLDEQLFDPARTPPALLNPGDQLRILPL